MHSPTSPLPSPDKELAPSLLVVCGLSGAGKSTVLQVLEDLDFFTADGKSIPIAELEPAWAERHLPIDKAES